MLSHRDYLGHDLDFRPIDAENFRQLLQVDDGGLADAVHIVAQPRHAQVAELLVEENLPKLVGKERNVFDDRLTHAPGLILSQFDNGR